MAFCYAVVLQLSAWKAMWRQKLDRTRVFLRNLLSFGTPGAEGGSREGSSTIVQTVLCSHDGHCSGVSDLKTYCCNAEKAVIPPILSWGMGWDCPDIRESGGRITRCSTGGCEETDLWSIWYRIEEKLGSRLDFFSSVQKINPFLMFGTTASTKGEACSSLSSEIQGTFVLLEEDSPFHLKNLSELPFLWTAGLCSRHSPMSRFMGQSLVRANWPDSTALREAVIDYAGWKSGTSTQFTAAKKRKEVLALLFSWILATLT